MTPGAFRRRLASLNQSGKKKNPSVSGGWQGQHNRPVAVGKNKDTIHPSLANKAPVRAVGKIPNKAGFAKATAPQKEKPATVRRDTSPVNDDALPQTLPDTNPYVAPPTPVLDPKAETIKRLQQRSKSYPKRRKSRELWKRGY